VTGLEQHTLVPGILDSRLQRFAARLADACTRKQQELHQNTSSSSPICRVVKREYEHKRTTDGMMLPARGEQSVVRTTILDNTTDAMRTAERLAREIEAKIRAEIWLWWSDGLRSDDGRAGAAAVCIHGHQWRSRRRILRTGYMEVFDAKMWAIGLALDVTIEKGDTLPRH
jgi:hypothetical protein